MVPLFTIFKSGTIQTLLLNPIFTLPVSVIYLKYGFGGSVVFRSIRPFNLSKTRWTAIAVLQLISSLVTVSMKSYSLMSSQKFPSVKLEWNVSKAPVMFRFRKD
jgi:hypothetical protein